MLFFTSIRQVVSGDFFQENSACGRQSITISESGNWKARLTKILADGGYHGSLGDWVSENYGWTVEIVLRPEECPAKFPVLPKRWIVERSFAWLENFRRLTIDYEFLADTAEAMVQLAFTQIMLNKFIQ